MSIKMNVAPATTTNSGMSVNNNNNSNNAKSVSVESVENAEVKAEDVEVKAENVEVRSQKRVALTTGMYYAWRYNSCDTQRLVLVTCIEIKRDGKRMIDYVMIEPDKYIGQNEKHEPLYTYKLHKYHKSSKWSGGADAPEIGEYVDGPNGVCVYPGELTIDDVKFSTIFGHGCLRLEEEMYDEFAEWLDFCNFGLKFIKLNDKRAEEKEAAKANADVNARVEWLKDNIAKAEAVLESIAEDYGVESWQFYDFGFGDWVIMSEEAAGGSEEFVDEDDYEPIQDHIVRIRLTHIHNVLDSWSKELNELCAKMER